MVPIFMVPQNQLLNYWNDFFAGSVQKIISTNVERCVLKKKNDENIKLSSKQFF